jgi:hypothetical protein
MEGTKHNTQTHGVSGWEGRKRRGWAGDHVPTHGTMAPTSDCILHVLFGVQVQGAAVGKGLAGAEGIVQQQPSVEHLHGFPGNGAELGSGLSQHTPAHRQTAGVSPGVGMATRDRVVQRTNRGLQTHRYNLQPASP